MERPQYDRSLRHTACSADYTPPELGIGSSSSSSDAVCDSTLRYRPEQKRLHSPGANSGNRMPSGSTGDGDKAAVRHSSSGQHAHATTTASTMFSRAAEPVVQTNNQLTDDYSRRIHCYILQAEGDDAAPSEHAPPPVLPSMEGSGLANIPFWRPPRVLQREPHYNYLSTRQAQHTGSQGTDQTSGEHLAAAETSALSPALLAIGNSHYNRQLQQDRAFLPQPYRDCRPSKPTIQSLLSPTTPPAQLESSGSAGVSAAHSPCDTGTQPSDSDYDGCSNDVGMTNANRLCTNDRYHYTQGVFTSTQCLAGSRLRLPPIDAPRPHAYHVSSQDPSQNLPCADSSRESMSIASLVGVPEAEVSCSERASQKVCLPSISSLEPGYNQEPGYNPEHHIPPAKTLQTAESTSLTLVQPRNVPQTGTVRPANTQSPSRKRLHGETRAAMALQKMARTETQTFACGRPPIALKAGKRIAVSSLRTLQQYPLCPANQVLITCYHASVAQKSYGGEKRFLCPPPAVLMYGEGFSARIAHHSPMLLSVVTDTAAAASKAGASGPQLQGASSQNNRRADGGTNDSARPSTSAHAPLECQTSFNERNVALFKSLHVTGMQKAKSFRLRLDLMTPPSIGGREHGMWHAPTAYASLESDAVAIISKPSKKTAKARNQSSCIREGSLISLFNRINSQTFRTKYLNVEHNTNRWIAQSHNWSPLEVVVVAAKGAARQPGVAGPLYYGSEIVLVESRRNFRSPPMIIHKVERGRLVENACSPVSQMQKIALQAKPTAPGAAPRYLKADVGHYSPASSDSSTPARFDDPDGSPELTFESVDSARLSRARAREPPAECGVELDDAFCWTIVGISGFTYAYTMPPEHSPRDSCISPMPRVMDASLGTDRTLSLSISQFDSSRMQVLLNGRPLETKLCATGKVAAGKVVATGSAVSSAASKPEPADRFTIQLPAGTEPGALCVRRDDGVLFHTKWAVQRKAPSAMLELVECNLDI
ncbi:hypothetical protein GGH12_002729 [Coemansia sp. RSA 1822]|nr:hypothetical protein GGH12_002729 [Coemansia sp. RSA 1822]